MSPFLHTRRFILTIVAGLTFSLGMAFVAAQDQKPEAGDKAEKKEKTSADSSKASKAKKDKDLKPFPEGPLEKQYVEKIGPDYKVRRTDHFFVLYNTEEQVLKEFIDRIERTYDSVHRFAVKMGIQITYPQEKLPVIFCETFDQYSQGAHLFGGQAAPAEAAGLYFPSANFSIFYNMANSDYIKGKTNEAKAKQNEARTSRDPNAKRSLSKQAQYILNEMENFSERNNKSVVQHEVAHQLLHNFDVHRRNVFNPSWFVEGLATLFEPPPTAGVGAGFNITNQYRLWRLRERIEKDQVMDLAELIKTREMLADGDRNYCHAWGLTCYISKYKKKEMQQYVELIKQRKPKTPVTPEQELADFEKCFGRLDEAFKTKWVKFIKELQYRPPR